MNLWIRSQDREKLIKCNDIAIRRFLYNEIPEEEWSYQIVGYFDKETEYEILGSYGTKERALEVLDEIANILKPKGIVKFDILLKPADVKIIEEQLNNKFLVFNRNLEYFEAPKNIVYEMPEE